MSLPNARVMPGLRSFLRCNRVTLVAAAAALALAGYIWFAMPHARTIESVWVLFFKLTPFVAAAVAIAWLDLEWARRLRLHLVAIPICFLVFFLFFVPNIFINALEPGREGWPELYYHMLAAVPFLILVFVLAYRLGGGSREGVLRLAGAMLLLQLSGLEDLAFLALSGIPIQDEWTWAHHMTVFAGRPLTKYEAFTFIGLHTALALLVLFLPTRVASSQIRRLVRGFGRLVTTAGTPRASGE
jgi:hypothetical protein